MPRVHAVVTFPYPTGLPRDVSQTTFSFVTLANNEETYQDISDGLQQFYNDPVAPATAGIAKFISNVVVREMCTITLYDVTTLPAGSPVFEETWTLAPAFSVSTPSLPLEVALVNSVKTAGTVNPRSRRGRQYIGPLNSSALAVTASLPRPDVGLIGAMVDASQRLAAKEDTYSWFVWSRKTSEFLRVVGGFVNNEFDTQRRRGADETDRSIWSRLV